eukprot:tig00020723_g13439.t1
MLSVATGSLPSSSYSAHLYGSVHALGAFDLGPAASAPVGPWPLGSSPASSSKRAGAPGLDAVPRPVSEREGANGDLTLELSLSLGDRSEGSLLPDVLRMRTPTARAAAASGGAAAPACLLAGPDAASGPCPAPLSPPPSRPAGHPFATPASPCSAPAPAPPPAAPPASPLPRPQPPLPPPRRALLPPLPRTPTRSTSVSALDVAGLPPPPPPEAQAEAARASPGPPPPAAPTRRRASCVELGDRESASGGPAPGRVSALPPSCSCSFRILLADDLRVNLMLASRIFGMYAPRAALRLAGDGAEAAAAHAAALEAGQPFDLCVLDLQMGGPAKDGIPCAEAVRRAEAAAGAAAARLVAWSSALEGDEDCALRLACEAAGFDASVPKRGPTLPLLAAALYPLQHAHGCPMFG